MHDASQERAKRFSSKIALSLALLSLATSAAAFTDKTPAPPTTKIGYTGIFGGGPLYKTKDNKVDDNIAELSKSGFDEIIVWNIAVDVSGNLNFNGEFPIASEGKYIGGKDVNHPEFAGNIAKLKKTYGIKRITFSIGSWNPDDFPNINKLIKKDIDDQISQDKDAKTKTRADYSISKDSILYKHFKALKDAIPSIDAIDLDDEHAYDSENTLKFAVMLSDLGYHVIPDAYTNSSYWTTLVKSINKKRPGTVDGVHLQVYDGGGNNDPCSSAWDFDGIPVYPGLADPAVNGGKSVAETKAAIAGWQKRCHITGAFLWLYDDVKGDTHGNGPADYAKAIHEGLTPQP
jgi:hypothetical protein